MQSAEQPDEAVRWGATPEEWAHWEIGEYSKVKKIGKTPSEYNGSGKVRGLVGWTSFSKDFALRQIDRWSAQPDYGICIRTGGEDGILAIDIDIDDPVQVNKALALVRHHLGDLPMRVRVNAPRAVLLVMSKVEVGEGEQRHRLRKEVIKTTDGGKIEILGEGHQFVACGTHDSGARYNWAGGLPDTIPEVTPEVLTSLMEALERIMGTEPRLSVGGGARRRGEHIEMDDPRAEWLVDQGLVIGEGDGRLDIICPFADGHSGDTGPSSTSYFPAGTNQFYGGHYKCQHGSCAGRKDKDFDIKLGCLEHLEAKAQEALKAIAEVSLVDMTDEDVPPATEVAGPSPRRATLDPKDTMLMARAFVGSCFGEGRSARLVRWGECWYEHLGTHYAEIGREPMRERGWGFLDEALRPSKDGPVRFAPEAKHVTTMIDATIKVAGVVSSAAPSWIRGTKGPDPREIAALQDGLLHIPTRTLLEHGPGFFSLNALPYAWGSGNGHAPVWERFLDDIWGDDAEAIETLQEIFGYLLTPDTSMQKMFLLVGPKRSGKGTIGRVLAGLLGVANMAAPTVNSIAGEFGLQPLIGKLVAIISDAREPSRALAGQLVERLLMLSGEDMITLNRKNKEMWTGNLTARVVISTNEVPRFYDASGAIASRFITLATSDSFLGREDPGLTKKLLGELPAIFRWALDGRDRLMARGYFRQPDSGRDVLDELEEAGSPIGAFVADMCVLEVGAVTAFDDLFEAWKGWCAVRGHQPGSSSSFGRKLSAGFPKLSTSRPRGEGDERFKAKGGIRLKTRNYARLDEMDEPA
jgi:P4 family phage/plasmid primase-like protien